jgi:hypothetical protein
MEVLIPLSQKKADSWEKLLVVISCCVASTYQRLFWFFVVGKKYSL